MFYSCHVNKPIKLIENAINNLQSSTTSANRKLATSYYSRVDATVVITQSVEPLNILYKTSVEIDISELIKHISINRLLFMLKGDYVCGTASF